MAYIVRNDLLMYAKGYGMANLEYDIPNTPSTIFHIAPFQAIYSLGYYFTGKAMAAISVHLFACCRPLV